MSVIGDKTLAAKRKDWFPEGVTPEEVVASYSDCSESYEEMMTTSKYQAPVITVKEVLRRVPSEKRPEARVLDVAAGTGWVGRELQREGFRYIDAVEPSEGMMVKLRESGVYTNNFVESVGTGHSSVPKDTYDLVIISGGMGEGHIPVSGLDDLVRVAKKGGLVIIAMRLIFLSSVPAYREKLEPYMKVLEERGAWRKVEHRIVPNYIFGEDGVLFTFKVL